MACRSLSGCMLDTTASGVGLPQVHWNRAARTDKGVSAAGNVVSLKMMIGYPDVVERINAALPLQVPRPLYKSLLYTLDVPQCISTFAVALPCQNKALPRYGWPPERLTSLP